MYAMTNVMPETDRGRGLVYIETYGCALNSADSGIMRSRLLARGYKMVSDPSQADVIIINTCTVRQDTEERMIKRIKELYGLSLKKGSLLVVAGCMASAQPYTVKKIAPGSLIVNVENVHLIDVALERREDLVKSPPAPKTAYTPKIEGVLRGKVAEVPIQDGCMGECSFCITKFARRKLLSRPIGQLVEIVREAVARGAVEVRLAGQDTGSYGMDLYGVRALPELVRQVASVPGKFMIRVGMANPDSIEPILDEFIEVLKHPKVYKFVHIPVQSGDDRVLRLMRRRYTVDDFKRVVKEIRSKVPGVMIATDIIVGHPGEDEEAFENTLRLIYEMRFERVHVAHYTPRPRTISAGLPQVPSSVKKERSKRVMALVERIGLEEHRRYIGSRALALVVERGLRGGLDAKLYNYMPVVLPEGSARLGEWRCVEIREATWYDLRGVAVEC